MAAAEIDEERGGPAVVGEDGFEYGGRVGWAEGGVGEGVEACFAGKF